MYFFCKILSFDVACGSDITPSIKIYKPVVYRCRWGEVNAFYMRQIFALDSAVARPQKVFSLQIDCVIAVCVLCLLRAVQWVGLQSVTVAFHDNTHLLSKSRHGYLRTYI